MTSIYWGKTMNFIDFIIDKLAEEQDYSHDVYIELEGFVDTEVKMSDAFKTVAPDFKFDKALCHRLIAYYQKLTSTENNIKWFGGCLLGTELIRFTQDNRDVFFEDVVGIDEDYLESQLEKTGLIQDWSVSSDSFNNTCSWLLHKAYVSSPGFADKLTYQAMVALLVIWQFRLYSSLYVGNFKRQTVDMPAAEATYSALTLKFSIKQLGSWQAALEYRAERFLSKESPHYKQGTYENFNDLKSIVYISTDMSTRVRRTFYDYYNILDQIRKTNSRLGTYGDAVNLEGVDMIRDRSRLQDMAYRYLINSSMSTNSFVKNEYLTVINELVTTSSPTATRDALIAISNLPLGKERDLIEDTMLKILLHTFDYVQSNKLKFTQIAYLLSKVRSNVTAAKSTDKDILFLRKTLEKFITKHTHLKHATTVAAVRTSILLYYVLFALSVNKD